MKTIWQRICALILVLLAVQGTAVLTGPAFADKKTDPAVLHLPERGNKTKTDGRLTIDYSHMDQGYVLVRAKKTEEKMKLSVEHGKDKLKYDINNAGQDEVIPLQLGSGKYRFGLWTAVSKGSTRYKRAGTISLDCRMQSETSCFLYPNQYVNYGADSPVVAKAAELCRNLSGQREIADTIWDYMHQYDYNYTKYCSILAGQTGYILPDIDEAWTSGMGVCGDLSALMCAMLRSRGIEAKLVIGTDRSGQPHAWVDALVDGKSIQYDPANKCFAGKDNRAERYY